MGYRVSGVYTLQPWQASEPFQVFCEQNYYGGGWTMIQRRRDGSENFDRPWDDYAQGSQGRFHNLHQLSEKAL